jgi:hypothetical protein
MTRAAWALLAVVALATPARAQETRAPQAAPIVAVLEAAKVADWPKNLEQARTNLTRMFGDYRLADFAFSFTGGTASGRVTLSYKGQPQFDLAVIEENGRWTLDER